MSDEPRRGGWLQSDRSAAVRTGLGFVVGAAGGVAWCVVYSLSLGVQAQGAALAVTFAGLGYGLITWGRELMHTGQYVQHREPLASEPAARAAVARDFDRADPSRRRLLAGLLAGAAGVTAAGLLFPVRSLGPRPSRAFGDAPWQAGRRLVTPDGALVQAGDIPLGGLLTAFPEGLTDVFDGQVVVMRVEPGLLRTTSERQGWTPEGLVAFSKVCTHAGCPVGLYQVETHQLLCPCHQSAFDVLNEARPVFGPAAEPLPQLPLRIGMGGLLEAAGELSAPVGPGIWRKRT